MPSLEALCPHLHKLDYFHKTELFAIALPSDGTYTSFSRWLRGLLQLGWLHRLDWLLWLGWLLQLSGLAELLYLGGTRPLFSRFV